MKDSNTLALDALFAECKAHERKAVPTGVGVSRNITQKIEASQLYAKAENWVLARNLALIHAETQTLLGNFQEWLHKSVPNCRRLVRVESPLVVSGTEQVSGTWGWTPPKRLEHQNSSLVRYEVTVDCQLAMPAVNAVATRLRVDCQGAGILAIRLVAATDFSDDLGLDVLSLPAETNLLPMLSLLTKQAIRLELPL